MSAARQIINICPSCGDKDLWRITPGVYKDEGRMICSRCKEKELREEAEKDKKRDLAMLLRELDNADDWMGVRDVLRQVIEKVYP